MNNKKDKSILDGEAFDKADYTMDFERDKKENSVLDNDELESVLDGKPFEKVDYTMDFERERKKEDAGISDKDIHYTESETEDVSYNQNNQTGLDYETNNQNSNEYKNNNNDENQEIKKLYRSKDNIMLAGVCSGIAEYFNIDPTLVRLGFVIFGFATNIFSLLAYITMSAIIPKRP